MDKKITLPRRFINKWSELKLTIRAFLPLLFIFSISLFIGGFSTIPSGTGLEAGLESVTPHLTQLEKDYISDNAIKLFKFSIESMGFPKTFISTRFAPSITITKNSLLFSNKPITKLFGVDLVTSDSFRSSVRQYIVITSSKEDSFVSKVASLKNKNGAKYLFFKNTNKGTYSLIKGDLVNIPSTWTPSETIDKLESLEKIQPANYPTLKMLSDFTIDSNELENYRPYDFIKNFTYSSESQNVITIGMYATYKKALIEKDSLKQKLAVSLSLGTIGLFFLALIIWYLIYLYRKITFKKNKGDHEAN